MPSNLHPISILIFRQGGQVSYKGYTALNYTLPNDVIDRDYDYELFVSKIYDVIGYDIQNNNMENTRFGTFLEHHTRFMEIDVTENNQDVYSTMYFSLYENPHTNYLCVHRNSPIIFNANSADSYATQQPNLIRMSCENTFL